MKICIGLNLYKNEHRNKLCLDSLYKLQKKFNIDIYNLQFINNTNIKDVDHVSTFNCLIRKSGDLVPNSLNQNLPTMFEMFDNLSKLNYDYFIYTNSDIIISDRYIQTIQSNKFDCYPASRLAINNIESINSTNIVPSHYQVAGFDTFAVKTEWWNCFKHLFPDYILGMPAWDVHYATVMMLYGNSMLCNKWPPNIFHIIHESPWVSDNTIPERQYCENLFFQTNKKIANIWNSYLFNVLLKRSNNYYEEMPNELELEKEYFNLCKLSE